MIQPVLADYENVEPMPAAAGRAPTGSILLQTPNGFHTLVEEK